MRSFEILLQGDPLKMGYFIASCVVTWLVLGSYVLILFVQSRRLRARSGGESGFAERD
ncbi:MAG: hypothetical protein ACR2NQ_01715 [Thermodesulfobacteriota bacterium]